MVFILGYVGLPGAFRGEKWLSQDHFLTPSKFEKGVKGRLVIYVIIISNTKLLKPWCDHYLSTTA